MSGRSPSLLRRLWRSVFGPPSGQIHSCPEDMEESTRVWLRRRQARYDFNSATTYPHPVLTRHGRAITPYRVEISGRSLSSNLVEFASQPRVHELIAQMQPLLSSKRQDMLMLDDSSGRFYLKSALEKNGADKAQPLGEIDLQTERMLFKHAAQTVSMQRLFGDASARNPIVLDEATGAVYPKNNPRDVRGHVRLGPAVHTPASGKPRR